MTAPHQDGVIYTTDDNGLWLTCSSPACPGRYRPADAGTFWAPTVGELVAARDAHTAEHHPHAPTPTMRLEQAARAMVEAFDNAMIDWWPVEPETLREALLALE